MSRISTKSAGPDAALPGQSDGGAAPPAPPPVRIALVDDEESMHQLVGNIFKKHAPGWVLESYPDCKKALKQIPQAPPHAVLMDISMPGGTGIECAKKLTTLLPDLPIVMLSAHVDPESLLNSMMAGSRGCLHKPATAHDIIQALKRAMEGSLGLCERAEKTMMEGFNILGKKFGSAELTTREEEIMGYLCQQKTDKEIAETLGIGSGTVHVHVSSIFKKLNVHTRAEAVRKIMG
jgi:DNA-binding NarL/FixJ family response regulator